MLNPALKPYYSLSGLIPGAEKILRNPYKQDVYACWKEWYTRDAKSS
jgi:hypothetical protein